MSSKLLSRDVHWLRVFNDEVFNETKKKTNTLGEQVFFHGVTHSNLREVLSVRYPSLITDSPDDVQTFISELETKVEEWTSGFRSFNKTHRIVRQYHDLQKGQRSLLDTYFKNNVFPALLPVTVDRIRTANITSGMYVMVLTEDEDRNQISYVEIPASVPRWVTFAGWNFVVPIEDLIQRHLKDVIHGRKIVRSCTFSVLRSAEVYVRSDAHSDPYTLVERTLKERNSSWVTLVEVGSKRTDCISQIQKLVQITENTLVIGTNMVRLADLTKIPKEIFAEKDRMRVFEPIATFPDMSVFDHIRKKDRLCLHPYESYEDSVVRFIEEAATDRDVVSIRITLYRTADNSRIVRALTKAADAGKLVAVLIELKARFDERHNMEVANVLREAGVRIVYTSPNIKTHCKVCLVARNEKKGLRIYSHIGTGNYNERSGYVDYSYFTANRKIGLDLTRFFNLLTSNQDDFKSREIIYSPYSLKDTVKSEIAHQVKLAKKGKSGRIIIKCNALTDPDVAERIEDAAMNSVHVTLIIRGACVVQPSKNLEIFSVVGRFLEHNRVYVFGTGKSASIYLGSSDLMTRSLARRNELMISVEQKDIRERIMKHISWYLKDTVNRRMVRPNYEYVDVRPSNKKKPFDAQHEMIKEAKSLGK